MDQHPVPSRGWHVPRLLWLGGLLVLGTPALAWLALHPRASATGAADNVPTHPPRRAVAIAYVDIDGGVTPLYPLKTGRVAEVLVREGQEVEAGAALFRLESTLEEIQKGRAELAVAGAKEKLEQAKSLIGQHQKKMAAQRSAIELARKDVVAARAQLEKARRIYNSGAGGSAEDVRAASALVEKAEAGVQAEQDKLAVLEAMDPQAAVRLAELEVKNKNDQLREAEYALGLCTLKAPEKGKVLRCLVSVGETLGSNPRQPAIQFCADKDRIVRAEVEQEFARLVHLDQKAKVQDDTTGLGDWTGKVVRISDWYTQRRSVLLEPLQFNDVRTLECIVKLDGKPKDLRIGQRVRVTLEGAGQ